jgi:hypothetical protein
MSKVVLIGRMSTEIQHTKMKQRIIRLAVRRTNGQKKSYLHGLSPSQYSKRTSHIKFRHESVDKPLQFPSR